MDKRLWLALPAAAAWVAVYASGPEQSTAAFTQASFAAAMVGAVTLALLYGRQRLTHWPPVSARVASVAFTVSLLYVYVNLGVLWVDYPGPDRWIVTVAALNTIVLLGLYLAAHYGVGLARRAKAKVTG